MNIGIGFKLFADASEFERGVVKSKATIRKLDDETKLVGKTFGVIGKAIYAAGIIQGFSTAINKAQQLRDESLKNGAAIDANTAALARYGDQLDSLKESAAKISAYLLGGLSRAGEKVGDFFQGEDSDAIRAEEKRIAEESERRSRSNDARAKATNDIKKLQRDLTYEEADSVGKINILLEENLRFGKAIERLGEDDVRREEYRVEIEKRKIEMAKLEKQIQEDKNRLVEKSIDDHNTLQEQRRKEAEDEQRALKQRQAAAERVAEARAALEREKSDSTKMTLQELAGKSVFSAGVSTELGQAGASAREVFELEKKSKDLAAAGDTAGAEDAMAEARTKRASLGKFISSREANPLGDLEAAVASAEGNSAETEDRAAAIGGVVRGSRADELRAGLERKGGSSAAANPSGDPILTELQGIHSAVKGKFVAQ